MISKTYKYLVLKLFNANLYELFQEYINKSTLGRRVLQIGVLHDRYKARVPSNNLSMVNKKHGQNI